jgi:endonuclease/exonuclease/phosphatase family metal-dependent hydrolase
MKFVTFNIRCDYGQDGDNNFRFRKPLILRKLAEETPDIICFQEVLPHVAAWLKQNLEDYYVVGCGRSETLEDEQVSIAYRNDRFNLIQMDTFWLSETPDVPASRYPDQSSCPRVCTEAQLQDLEAKTVFRVVNTHLDHIGVSARRKGLLQILRRLESERLFPQAPVILAGDFNAEPDGEELLAFRDFPGYVNATEGIGITYHGYLRAAPESADYIFLKGDVSCVHVEKWTQEAGGVYLSDHYPVCAELKWVGAQA